jgi:hypothetical protein
MARLIRSQMCISAAALCFLTLALELDIRIPTNLISGKKKFQIYACACVC